MCTHNIIINGNIFDSKMQVLVNPVNCVGVMGKGLALEFKGRFPDMFQDYKRKCKLHQIKLGKPYLYISLQYDNSATVNFPTKYHWRDKSNLHDIKNGLKHLIDYLWIMGHNQNLDISSIAIPLLGCGLGGLDQDTVAPIIQEYLCKMDIDTELYVELEHDN